MTPLATEFVFRDCSFRQLKRRGKVALYERIQDGHTGYEVIRIKSLAQREWPDGRVTEAHEAYPGDEQFGTSAWYFMASDLEGAEVRFRAETRGKVEA